MKKIQLSGKRIPALAALCLAFVFAMVACDSPSNPRSAADGAPPIFTVTFDAGDESVFHSARVQAGDTVDRPNDPVRPGYAFEGWFTSDTFLAVSWFDFNSPITADMTLFARWQKAFTVTFDARGGYPDMFVQPVAPNERVFQPLIPAKDGYMFIGWFTGPEFIPGEVYTPFDFSTPITADLTLFAWWLLRAGETFWVSFNTQNGMQWIPSQEVPLNGLVIRPQPDPVEEGNTFRGWFTTADGTTPFDFDAPTTYNRDAWAQWEASSFTIDFVMQGGSPQKPAQTVTWPGLATRPAPDPTNEGYVFAGWFNSAAGHDWTPFDFNTPVTSNRTAYARWHTGFVISFDMQGGAPQVPAQILVWPDLITRPSPDPTKENHTFYGWSIGPGEGHGTVSFDSLRPDSSMTLYAQWQANAFTVTFDTQGGTPQIPAQTVNRNAQATRPSPDPTKAGFLFAGWFTASGTWAPPFDFDAPTTSNRTAYAGWDPAVTVSFDMRGGSPQEPAQTVLAGSLITRPPTDPAKEGHTFIDWFTGPDWFHSPFEFHLPINSNRTAYARWEIAFAVDFVMQGGYPQVPRQTVILNGLATRPPVDPEREGHTFRGWFTGATSTTLFDFNAPVTSNRTAYAQWKVNWNATAYGTPVTTAINLTFDAPVTGLEVGHITITSGTGSATRGTLSGSGTNWTLGITDVMLGNILVEITRADIAVGVKTVAVLGDIVVSGTFGDFTVTAIVSDSNAFSFSGNVLRINANGRYTISGTTTTDHIVISSGLTNVNITFSGLNINVSNVITAFGGNGVPAVAIGGAPVNLTLVGTNILRGGSGPGGTGGAGIEVQQGAALVITGESTGSLDVTGGNGGGGGAGIGGNGRNHAGNITVLGGNITARGGNGATGGNAVFSSGGLPGRAANGGAGGGAGIGGGGGAGGGGGLFAHLGNPNGPGSSGHHGSGGGVIVFGGGATVNATGGTGGNGGGPGTVGGTVGGNGGNGASIGGGGGGGNGGGATMGLRGQWGGSGGSASGTGNANNPSGPMGWDGGAGAEL